MATLECIIGLCLISGRAQRGETYVLGIELIGILSPLRMSDELWGPLVTWIDVSRGCGEDRRVGEGRPASDGLPYSPVRTPKTSRRSRVTDGILPFHTGTTTLSRRCTARSPKAIKTSGRFATKQAATWLTYLAIHRARANGGPSAGGPARSQPSRPTS